MSKVLVTGASGYIALHVVDQLVKGGYRVRGTVRSLNNDRKVKPLLKLGQGAKYPIELVEADLLCANSWKKAAEGVDVVMHTASPVILDENVAEEEIVRPAVEGTLNVLNAALAAGVKRVVLTSSVIAIGDFQNQDEQKSEDDWADVEIKDFAYRKSKILAEREAWNFVESRKKRNESCFELAVIHPSVVLGPMLSREMNPSVSFFLKLFQGRTSSNNLPLRPWPMCDVRDVALAHIKAAFLTQAVGHRHIISSEELIPSKRLADILRREITPKGYNIPDVEDDTEHLPKFFRLDTTRMKKVLGILPYDLNTTIIDMANSMIEHGIIEPDHINIL